MIQEDLRASTDTPQQLGDAFEAQNSVSDDRALGASFELHNAVSPEEREAILEKRRPKSHLWIWITLIILIAAIVLYAYHERAAKKAAGAVPAGGSGHSGRGQNGPASITVGQTKSGNINVYVDALGTVTPTNTTTIYSQITGKILAVHYREGQIVHKGDPLVEIDPRPYESTLTQAEGTLEHDKALLAEARIDLKRYQDAFARNAIARQQLEDQEQVVLQDQGTVKTDEGTVLYDQVQLSYCHIVAPISGKIGLRLVDPGNTVFSGTGSTLAVITQINPITVVFNVSEDDLPQVQAQLKGRKALQVDAYDRADDKLLESGKLTSLDNQIDTTTGTVKFRATFANKNNALYANQFVNARLLVKTLENATLIPTAAVQQNGTQAFVYLVKDSGANHTVVVQNITTQTSNEKVTAATGIAPNTNIATSGFDRLENNAKVLLGPPGGGGKGKSSDPSGTLGSSSSSNSSSGSGSGSTGSGSSSGNTGK